MRRLLLVLAVLLAAIGGSQALASAGSGSGSASTDTPAPRAADPVPAERSRTDSTASAAAPTTSTAAPAVTAPDTSPPVGEADEVRPARPQPNDVLRLRCGAAASPSGRGVACTWSASQHPRFAGYRLVRGDGEERVVVFRTRDRAVLRHLDTTIDAGQRYRYAVQVVDANGTVIGQGGPATAGVPAPTPVPDPQPEVLRFECGLTDDGEPRGVTCRWGAAEGGARGYVLYRSVDGGGREAIYRTGPDGRLGHLDSSLRPGHRATYAVVALDGSGAVVGQGGPVTVGIPPSAPATSSTDPVRSG